MPKTKVRKDGRVCTKCNKFLYWNFFYKSKLGIKGRRSNCKDCNNIYGKKHEKTYNERRKKIVNAKNRLDPTYNERNRLNKKFYRDKTNKRNREILGGKKKPGEAKEDKITWLSNNGYNREYLELLYK